MIRYEILILAAPEITLDETKNIETKLQDMIEEYKGSVISFERWGKYKLAYSINHNDYGVYFLMRFEVDKDHSKELFKEFDSLFKVKLSDLVMRNMLIELNKDESLAYKRPESLEEVPAQNVDKFLKENKMSGLLNSSKSDSKKSESTESGKFKEKDNTKDKSEEIKSEKSDVKESNEDNSESIASA